MYYTLALSFYFLIAAICAYVYTGEESLFENIFKIITSPSRLVTDYFALGGLAATFFNVALCGFLSVGILALAKNNIGTSSVAGYMLVVAHGFYGLNFVNMWPPLIGVLIYSLITKTPLGKCVHTALFSTALAPFVSELVFRYTQGGEVLSAPRVTFSGILLALFFGIVSGFLAPALIFGTAEMHRGYNMYKAGLALGLFGIFIYNFLYTSFGISLGAPLEIDNPEYYALPYSYLAFINVFFISLFALHIISGVLIKKGQLSDYKKLFLSTGYGIDYLDKYGMGISLINVGLLGFCAISYLNIVFVLPEIFPALPLGVGFTGATVGVVFAALTFAMDGQQPRTVYPIVIGYTVLFLLVVLVSRILGNDIPWTLSSQSYINGLAFSTGLCPFSGKYGRRTGVVAGFLAAIICTTTAEMHGGLVLYNGGFTAGLTALVLLPILDFYKLKPKHDDDK